MLATIRNRRKAQRFPTTLTAIEKVSIHDIFPDELLLLIFSFLTAKDVARIATVCKKWDTLSKDRQLNKLFTQDLATRQQSRLDMISGINRNLYTQAAIEFFSMPQDRYRLRAFDKKSAEIVRMAVRPSFVDRIKNLRYFRLSNLMDTAPAPSSLALYGTLIIASSSIIIMLQTFLPNIACDIMAYRLYAYHRASVDQAVKFYKSCLTDTDLTLMQRFYKSYLAQTTLIHPALLFSSLLFGCALIIHLRSKAHYLRGLMGKLSELARIEKAPIEPIESSHHPKLKIFATLFCLGVFTFIGCVVAVVCRLLMPTYYCRFMANTFNQPSNNNNQLALNDFLEKCLSRSHLPLQQQIANMFNESSYFNIAFVASSLILFIGVLRHLIVHTFSRGVATQNGVQDDVEAQRRVFEV